MLFILYGCIPHLILYVTEKLGFSRFMNHQYQKSYQANTYGPTKQEVQSEFKSTKKDIKAELYNLDGLPFQC